MSAADVDAIAEDFCVHHTTADERVLPATVQHIQNITDGEDMDETPGLMSTPPCSFYASQGVGDAYKCLDQKAGRRMPLLAPPTSSPTANVYQPPCRDESPIAIAVAGRYTSTLADPDRSDMAERCHQLTDGNVSVVLGSSGFMPRIRYGGAQRTGWLPPSGVRSGSPFASTPPRPYPLARDHRETPSNLVLSEPQPIRSLKSSASLIAEDTVVSLHVGTQCGGLPKQPIDPQERVTPTSVWRGRTTGNTKSSRCVLPPDPELPRGTDWLGLRHHLRQHTHREFLTCLDLNEVSFADEDWRWLCHEVLHQLVALQELRLTRTGLTDARLGELLRGCGIGSRDGGGAGTELTSTSCSSRARSNATPLGSRAKPTAGRLDFSGVRTLPLLRVLHLGGNHLTHRGATYIGKLILWAASTLDEIRLPDNPLQDYGFQILGIYLAQLQLRHSRDHHREHPNRRFRDGTAHLGRRDRFHRLEGYQATDSSTLNGSRYVDADTVLDASGSAELQGPRLLDARGCSASARGISDLLAGASRAHRLTTILMGYNTPCRSPISSAATATTSDGGRRGVSSVGEPVAHATFSAFATLFSPCSLTRVSFTRVPLGRLCSATGCRELMLNLFFCCPVLEVLDVSHSFEARLVPLDDIEFLIERGILMYEELGEQEGYDAVEAGQQDQSIDTVPGLELVGGATSAGQTRVGDVLCELVAHAALHASTHNCLVPDGFARIQELHLQDTGLTDVAVRSLVTAVRSSAHTGVLRSLLVLDMSDNLLTSWSCLQIIRAFLGLWPGADSSLMALALSGNRGIRKGDLAALVSVQRAVEAALERRRAERERQASRYSEARRQQHEVLPLRIHFGAASGEIYFGSYDMTGSLSHSYPAPPALSRRGHPLTIAEAASSPPRVGTLSHLSQTPCRLDGTPLSATVLTDPSQVPGATSQELSRPSGRVSSHASGASVDRSDAHSRRHDPIAPFAMPTRSSGCRTPSEGPASGAVHGRRVSPVPIRNKSDAVDRAGTMHSLPMDEDTEHGCGWGKATGDSLHREGSALPPTRDSAPPRQHMSGEDRMMGGENAGLSTENTVPREPPADVISPETQWAEAVALARAMPRSRLQRLELPATTALTSGVSKATARQAPESGAPSRTSRANGVSPAVTYVPGTSTACSVDAVPTSHRAGPSRDHASPLLGEGDRDGSATKGGLNPGVQRELWCVDSTGDQVASPESVAVAIPSGSSPLPHAGTHLQVMPLLSFPYDGIERAAISIRSGVGSPTDAGACSMSAVTTTGRLDQQKKKHRRLRSFLLSFSHWEGHVLCRAMEQLLRQDEAGTAARAAVEEDLTRLLQPSASALTGGGDDEMQPIVQSVRLLPPDTTSGMLKIEVTSNERRAAIAERLEGHVNNGSLEGQNVSFASLLSALRSVPDWDTVEAVTAIFHSSAHAQQIIVSRYRNSPAAAVHAFHGQQPQLCLLLEGRPGRRSRTSSSTDVPPTPLKPMCSSEVGGEHVPFSQSPPQPQMTRMRLHSAEGGGDSDASQQPFRLPLSPAGHSLPRNGRNHTVTDKTPSHAHGTPPPSSCCVEAEGELLTDVLSFALLSDNVDRPIAAEVKPHTSVPVHERGAFGDLDASLMSEAALDTAFGAPIRVRRRLSQLSGRLKTFTLSYAHNEGDIVCRGWRLLHSNVPAGEKARHCLQDDFLAALQPPDEDTSHAVESVLVVRAEEVSTLLLHVETNERRSKLIARLQGVGAAETGIGETSRFPRFTAFLCSNLTWDTIDLVSRYVLLPGREDLRYRMQQRHRAASSLVHYCHGNASALERELGVESIDAVEEALAGNHRDRSGATATHTQDSMTGGGRHPAGSSSHMTAAAAICGEASRPSLGGTPQDSSGSITFEHRLASSAETPLSGSLGSGGAVVSPSTAVPTPTASRKQLSRVAEDNAPSSGSVSVAGQDTHTPSPQKGVAQLPAFGDGPEDQSSEAQRLGALSPSSDHSIGPSSLHWSKYRQLMRVAYDGIAAGAIPLDASLRQQVRVGKGRWGLQRVLVTLEWQVFLVMYFDKVRSFSSNRRELMLVHPVALGFSCFAGDMVGGEPSKTLCIRIERPCGPEALGVPLASLQSRLLAGATRTASSRIQKRDLRERRLRQKNLLPCSFLPNAIYKVDNREWRNGMPGEENEGSGGGVTSGVLSCANMSEGAFALPEVSHLLQRQLVLDIAMDSVSKVRQALTLLQDGAQRAKQAIAHSLRTASTDKATERAPPGR